MPGRRFSFPMPQRVKQGLIYWPCNSVRCAFGPQGPYLFDLTNNNVVTFAAAGPTANLVDSAVFVGASSQNLSLAHHASYTNPRGTGMFAVACWVKATTTVGGGNQSFFNQRVSANLWTLRMDTAGTFGFAVFDNGNVARTAADVGVASTSTWYFVVGWFDTNRSLVFCQVNMGVINTAACVGMVAESTEAVGIGGFTGQFLTGSVSGACYWPNRIPTQAELSWLYNNGQGRDLRRAA